MQLDKGTFNSFVGILDYLEVLNKIVAIPPSLWQWTLVTGWSQVTYLKNFGNRVKSK